MQGLKSSYQLSVVVFNFALDLCTKTSFYISHANPGEKMVLELLHQSRTLMVQVCSCEAMLEGTFLF